MRFHSLKLKTYRLLSCTLMALALILCPAFRPAFAGEEGGEAKTEGGEGEKKGAGPLPREQKEFGEKTQRLNSLSSRIEESEKQFRELVERKSHEKSVDEKQRIIKQLNDVTADRNKSAEEYNKIKSDLSLRYPNQGTHLDRRYQTQPKKSVEELEGSAGLDELLTRTKKVIDRKFAPFAPPEDAKKISAKKAAEVQEQKTGRLRLEK